MAMGESLRSRAGLTMPVPPELSGMNNMLGPNKPAADALDFFGAIRNLVENAIPTGEIQRYRALRKQDIEFSVVGSACGSSTGGIVAQELRAENEILRKKVSDLERALEEAQRPSRQQLVRVL